MTTCCRCSARLEDHFLGDSEHHGAGGGWRIEAPRLSLGRARCVGDAAEQMGIRRTPDFNTGDNEGVELFPRQPEARPPLVVGARLSEAGAEPAESAAGKERAGRARLIRSSTAAPSACASCQGDRGRRSAHQGRSHSLCRLNRFDAGPAALRHRARGLADAARHRVVLDRQGVGRNLQDHLQQRAIYKVVGVQHAERDLLHSVAARPDGARLRLPPPRAADHGAVAARHLHPLRSTPRARQYPVPRPAAVARQVRRSPASLSRDHGQRVQSAADLARHRAHPLRKAGPTAPRSRRTISRPTTTARSQPMPSAPRGG